MCDTDKYSYDKRFGRNKYDKNLVNECMIYSNVYKYNSDDNTLQRDGAVGLVWGIQNTHAATGDTCHCWESCQRGGLMPSFSSPRGSHMCNMFKVPASL